MTNRPLDGSAGVANPPGKKETNQNLILSGPGTIQVRIISAVPRSDRNIIRRPSNQTKSERSVR